MTRYPLCPMQHGMLYQHLAEPESDVDLQQIICTVREPLDRIGFADAWRDLTARHAALRVAFRWQGVDEPFQEIVPHVELPLEFRDWRTLDAGERERRFEAAIQRDRNHGFDLSRAPLFRLSLFQFDDSEYRFLWSFHHIVMDGRSTALCLQELFALLDAHRSGQAAELPSVPAYEDHVRWLARRDTRADEAYWRETLAGFRRPTPLPGRAGQGPGAFPAGTHGRREREIRLSEEETAALRAFAQEQGLRINTLAQGAWALLLSRFSGEEDVVFGVTRACRGRDVPNVDRLVGVLINTMPMRVRVEPEMGVGTWLAGLEERRRSLRAHELTPFVDVHRWSDVEPRTPVFHTHYMFDHSEMGSSLRELGGAWNRREIRIVERTAYPLSLYAYAEPRLLLRLAYDADRIADPVAGQLLEHLVTLLREFPKAAGRRVAEVSSLPAAERDKLFREWNDTATELTEDVGIHELFEAQVARTPSALALVEGEDRLTYRELDEAANRVAEQLRAAGTGPDTIVGLHVERTTLMVVGLLGILKAGGAYLPLDPAYPEARLRFMLEDSGARHMVTTREMSLRAPAGVEPIFLEEVSAGAEDAGTVSGRERTAGTQHLQASEPGARDERAGSPSDLAYVIYTSGSTGVPKGVMVEHRNVVNFFLGMDERLGARESGVWLAVTSLSFDISVLELLWTLTRGFRVVLYSESRARTSTTTPAARDKKQIDFGLFYFSASPDAEETDRYRLLKEGASYADRHGYSAVWTPERHFHTFGGLYPNPSVTGAAVAAMTDHLRIRAGSVVLPLHHPVRVAEEWSVVDNLSGGRVELSFASGWQRNDFIFAPDHYEDRHAIMYRGIDMIRRLWRGESVWMPSVDGEQVEIRLFPPPVQDELPFWVTAAGSPETFRRAGEIGAYLLTHLLGQRTRDLAEKIHVYRRAWEENGHGPGEGRVAVMLHTFVGDDDEQVRRLVREPLKEYLRTSVSLIRNYAGVWKSYSRKGEGMHARGDEFETLSAEDMEALLDQAFDRYYEESGLLGTPERCLRMVRELQDAGVDELACLIDFGVETDVVLRALPALSRLRDDANRSAEDRRSLPELVSRHGVTHLQCTPSFATLLLAEPASRDALTSLRLMLVGGEALPGALADELRAHTSARILNMYGPTETTVWSCVHELSEPVGGGVAPIGSPIANTRVYVLDSRQRPVPIGVAGELYIGGAGVGRGYLGRPEMTAERYVRSPFSENGDERIYRTGDRVRYRFDGTLEFLGRTDHQVKIRGHRVELGEIEAAIREQPSVREAVADLRGDALEEQRIVGFVVPRDLDAGLNVEELRESLRSRLPEFMVPSIFVELESLPLTPNGKVDRHALPEAALPASAEATQPASVLEVGLEHRLAELWAEVLGVQRVGPTDNFFELGGNSLSTIQLASRIRERFGVELPLRAFFRVPTVAELAAEVERELLAQVDEREIISLLEEMESLSDEEARSLAEADRVQPHGSTPRDE
ncbi:MAG: MupA/Atu3671 family FMN-dependent luciferase-like monooxygenase [Gemmatimonadota bacterium]